MSSRRCSTSSLEGRRRLRQSGARKRGQQACVKPDFLLDIGRIPFHRLGLAAEPAPEIVFGRRTRPHPGYVAGDLVGHRAYVVLPTRGSSLGVLAGHGFHRSILRQAPLEGDTRAGDGRMHGLNTPFSVGSRLRLHLTDSNDGHAGEAHAGATRRRLSLFEQRSERTHVAVNAGMSLAGEERADGATSPASANIP